MGIMCLLDGVPVEVQAPRWVAHTSGLLWALLLVVMAHKFLSHLTMGENVAVTKRQLRRLLFCDDGE